MQQVPNKNLQKVFGIPKSMKKDFRYTFCPGCDHGIAIRLLGEVIDELGIREEIITSTSVGCSVFLYDFLDVDAVEAPHGRALASATGVKRHENYDRKVKKLALTE